MYRSVDLSEIKDKEERKRIKKIQKSIQLPSESLTDYDIGNAFMWGDEDEQNKETTTGKKVV